MDCSSLLSVSNLLFNLLNRVASSVRGGDEGDDLPVLVTWRKRGKGRFMGKWLTGCKGLWLREMGRRGSGKGWVLAEVVAGEVKRTGESKTMMGAVMAGKKKRNGGWHGKGKEAGWWSAGRKGRRAWKEKMGAGGAKKWGLQLRRQPLLERKGSSLFFFEGFLGIMGL
ncbi:hypothetical protein OIU85_002516 [Salix viminalis]|uniref:Uncharacterized protein n=1 Tax=Salix viminalis TaxID=40686 RepID=A0A9Q0ZYY6_SALVM|nr:hypothetical protein OIU85_002516 [Salix viminalis]